MTLDVIARILQHQQPIAAYSTETPKMLEQINIIFPLQYKYIFLESRTTVIFGILHKKRTVPLPHTDVLYRDLQKKGAMWRFTFGVTLHVLCVSLRPDKLVK